jgi:hypothetical protein
MIEIKKVGFEPDYRFKRDGYPIWRLFQNGEEIQEVYITASEVQSFTNSTSIKLSKSNIYEFPKDCVVILKRLIEIGFWSINIEIGKNALGIVNLNISPIQESEYLIKFVMTYDLNNWKEKYSFLEYREVFTKILDGRDVFYLNSGNDLQIKNYEDIYDNKVISIAFHNFIENSIYGDIEEYLNFLKNIHLETVKTILTKITEGVVAFTFNFPEKIKITCEQYLLYFAQFLRDIGINATSNLKEEAGKVLFSVTPTDDVEALDKIREALAVYLNLPSSPIVYDDSFAAMRLQQQIENLQHLQKMAVREIRSGERELRLAQTVIEHQDKIINQKDSIIEQQNKVIEKIQSKSIMMDSVENKEELEELYDGLKVGESETLKKWLGIELNPAKVIKTAVKNTFGKDDKKSVLGLEEDL